MPETYDILDDLFWYYLERCTLANAEQFINNQSRMFISYQLEYLDLEDWYWEGGCDNFWIGC